ncbi:MAG TPA: phosphate acyltransferase [Chthoniobacterales bacterium]
MKFIESVFEKLARHPKRIVFPEGTEPRVLKAAGKFASLKLGTPILLGDRSSIESAARNLRVDLNHVMIINPPAASDFDTFVSRLEKLERYRKMGPANCRELMLNANFFGAMMLQYGQADALVGGASAFSSSLLRPLIQIIAPLPHIKTISSCTIMEMKDNTLGDKGVLFMGDCAVVPDPDVQQLAAIAVETGRLSRQLTGTRPRVALLSFSTRGSAKMPLTEKVAAATALAKKMADEQLLDMAIDGELQADAALLAEVAEKKVPSSEVAGKANVLIFPDLNSGNIASKLVHYLAKPDIYGQLLTGLSRPAAELSRGATVDEIVGVAAIAGLQAIQYRKLYPHDEPLEAFIPA